LIYVLTAFPYINVSQNRMGRRDRSRIVLGFTTTYAISVYHHWCCEFESIRARCTTLFYTGPVRFCNERCTPVMWPAYTE